VSLDEALDALEVAAGIGHVAWIEAHHADCVAARGCGCLWAAVLELALGAQVGEELGLRLVLAVGNVMPVDPAKVRGAPGAGGAVSSAAAAAASAAAKAAAAAAAAAAAKAAAAAAAATSTAIRIDCANCSKLGAENLVRKFVFHEQSLKSLEPLGILHESGGLEHAADGQRERVCGSVLFVDSVDRLVDDVAVPVVRWLVVATYEGGVQGLGDEGMEAAVFDKTVDGIERRAALAVWVVRGAKMLLTTLRDAVPGRS
jgi:hypothetical protein